MAPNPVTKLDAMPAHTEPKPSLVVILGISIVFGVTAGTLDVPDPIVLLLSFLTGFIGAVARGHRQ